MEIIKKKNIDPQKSWQENLLTGLIFFYVNICIREFCTFSIFLIKYFYYVYYNTYFLIIFIFIGIFIKIYQLNNNILSLISYHEFIIYKFSILITILI